MLAASASLDAELTAKSQRRGSQRGCTKTPSEEQVSEATTGPRYQDLKEEMGLRSAEMKAWRRLLVGVSDPGGMARTGELVSCPSIWQQLSLSPKAALKWGGSKVRGKDSL